MKLVPFPGLTIDPKGRVYIERHGSSAQAVSFDDVFDLTNALSGRLKQPSMAIAPTEIGSVEAYRRYRVLLAKAARELPRDETWYHPRTRREVRQELESARINRLRVRLYYGDQATGLDRLEVADTVGFVGRAGIDLQYPVLLAQPGDRHGVRISDAAVIRIALVDHHVDLWKHPQYHLPTMDYVPLLSGRARLVVDDALDLDFVDDTTMSRYRRFVSGEVHVSPLPSLA